RKKEIEGVKREICEIDNIENQVVQAGPGTLEKEASLDSSADSKGSQHPGITDSKDSRRHHKNAARDGDSAARGFAPRRIQLQEKARRNTVVYAPARTGGAAAHGAVGRLCRGAARLCEARGLEPFHRHWPAPILRTTVSLRRRPLSAAGAPCGAGGAT